MNASGPAALDEINLSPLIARLYDAWPRFGRWQMQGRFWLRYALTRSASQRWFAFLRSQPELLPLLHANRWLLEKIHRPYARRSLRPGAVADLLISHYRFVLSEPGRALFEAQGASRLLAKIEGKDGASYRWRLEDAIHFKREGELALLLQRDEQLVMAMVFCIDARATAAPRLLIGCLQGGKDAAELIRTTTRALHGLMPRKAMLIALQAIAHSVGVSRIEGVCSDEHVWRHWRKRKQLHLNYDHHWQELDGTRLDDGHYLLPSHYPERPLSELPSKKRAEAARKQAVVESISQQITEALHVQLRP